MVNIDRRRPLPDPAPRIRENYLRVLEQIEQAAQRAGRPASDARLIVVTKTHPPENVRAAIDAGARDLGENYAEEAIAKILEIGAVDGGLRWHMIGHVQSRKAKLIPGHFGLAQTVDSLKLAALLDRFAAERGVRQPILLEVNVSGEESKFGYSAWDSSAWDRLLPEFEKIAALPNLEICGLMTMPPFAEAPEASRPFFKRMRALQVFLDKAIVRVNWRELSMGTSLDFAVAIEEGATLVRVGTAILGPRPIKG
jgi:pyridoxal phosphate enzyme (YggS family)